MQKHDHLHLFSQAKRRHDKVYARNQTTRERMNATDADDTERKGAPRHKRWQKRELTRQLDSRHSQPITLSQNTRSNRKEIMCTERTAEGEQAAKHTRHRHRNVFAVRPHCVDHERRQFVHRRHSQIVAVHRHRTRVRDVQNKRRPCTPNNPSTQAIAIKHHLSLPCC
jgi:hypothetical protein